MAAVSDPTERPAGYVVKVPGLGYYVRSRTVDGGWWLVVGPDCSCPATRRCWHVQQTVEYEDLLTKPRPVAPPNVAALVD